MSFVHEVPRLVLGPPARRRAGLPPSRHLSQGRSLKRVRVPHRDLHASPSRGRSPRTPVVPSRLRMVLLFPLSPNSLPSSLHSFVLPLILSFPVFSPCVLVSSLPFHASVLLRLGL